MNIERLSAVTEGMVGDINKVNSQLHDDGRTGTLEELQAIVANPDAVIVVAKDGDAIVGLASLYILRKIGKVSAYIEDVVVDEGQRGKGLGEQLVRKVIDIARESGVSTIYLTSRPIHAAAHGLYKKVGFGTKETTVFKMNL